VSEASLATTNQTLLTTISQIDPIWVGFTISENEQLRLSRAATAGQLALPKDNAYDVTVKLSDGSAFPRKGKINFADSRVNPATGTYEMRAELPNADGALKPGQFVRVVLRGAQRKDAITVPQKAVLDGPQGKFVYVPGKDKDGKDVAQPRPVQVGDWVDADGGNLWVVGKRPQAGRRGDRRRHREADARRADQARRCDAPRREYAARCVPRQRRRRTPRPAKATDKSGTKDITPGKLAEKPAAQASQGTSTPATADKSAAPKY
jgi:multidrug efflux pump subunit AcrA (membrane-fusion protein)